MCADSVIIVVLNIVCGTHFISCQVKREFFCFFFVLRLCVSFNIIVSLIIIMVTLMTKATCNSPPNYSETSDSGPSEKGTQYERPLYKGHCLRSQKITFPIVSIH